MVGDSFITEPCTKHKYAKVERYGAYRRANAPRTDINTAHALRWCCTRAGRPRKVSRLGIHAVFNLDPLRRDYFKGAIITESHLADWRTTFTDAGLGVTSLVGNDIRVFALIYPKRWQCRMLKLAAQSNCVSFLIPWLISIGNIIWNCEQAI